MQAIAKWQSETGECRATVDPESFKLITELEIVELEVDEFLIPGSTVMPKCIRRRLPKKKEIVRLPGMIVSRSIVRLLVDDGNRAEIERWLESREGIAAEYKKDVTLEIGEHRFTVFGAWPNPVGFDLSDSGMVELIHDDIREG